MSTQSARTKIKPPSHVCCIFVHAGAGFHSVQNEAIHLQACTDAAKAAMTLLKAGGSAVDAVEIAIKVLEDREITNAGYGSNLAMDGIVECDAVMVDHHGRSGGVGAVAQIKNPISLARLLLNHSSIALSLRRVPPNFLVGQGATDFAYNHGLRVIPHNMLISPGARDRWLKWKSDLEDAEQRERAALQQQHGISHSPVEPVIDVLQGYAEQEQHRQAHVRNMQALYNDAQPVSPRSRPSPPAVNTPRSRKSSLSPSARQFTDPRGPPVSLNAASTSPFMNSTQCVLEGATSREELVDAGYDASSERYDGSDPRRPGSSHEALPEDLDTMDADHAGAGDIDGELYVDGLNEISAADVMDSGGEEDNITDTVGAIAIDSYGNMACGASSGGIGMKYRGRVGPAALVNVGACLLPVDADDYNRTSVATVTSGTGEHMATTQAAATCSRRVMTSQRRGADGEDEDVAEDEAIKSFIEHDFMGHPSIKHTWSSGAIGIVSVKKCKDGCYIYYAHNTESFALANMCSYDDRPNIAMSRSRGNGSITQGGRSIRFNMRKSR